MAVQEYTWMAKEMFLNWLHHFTISVPQGVFRENKNLLIVFVNCNHVVLKQLKRQRDLGVDSVTFPAWSGHKLQALDISVFIPFNTHFKSEKQTCTEKIGTLKIRIHELAILSSKAFKRALTPLQIFMVLGGKTYDP